MAEATKSLAQQYYEQVEALKGDGMSNAEAVRKVADQHSKSENAVRSSIHQYKTRSGLASSNGGRRSRRTRATSVEDYVANARRAIEEALALVDHEVDDAKAALDTAQAHYEQVAGSVKERKADLERKLKALS